MSTRQWGEWQLFHQPQLSTFVLMGEGPCSPSKGGAYRGAPPVFHILVDVIERVNLSHCGFRSCVQGYQDQLFHRWGGVANREGGLQKRHHPPA